MTNRIVEIIKNRAPVLSLQHLVIVTVLTTTLLLGVSAVGLWVSVRTSAGIDAQKRSDEIAACGREYRAPIDQASARLTLATAARDAARTARDDAYLVGLIAAVQNDQAALGELIATAPAVRQAVADAQQEVDDAAADVVAATDRYQRLARLSRTDPGEFLAACRKSDGVSGL